MTARVKLLIYHRVLLLLLSFLLLLLGLLLDNIKTNKTRRWLAGSWILIGLMVNDVNGEMAGGDFPMKRGYIKVYQVYQLTPLRH